MNDSSSVTHWTRKFARAGRGIVCGMRGQSSFPVHGLSTVAVATLASYLQITRTEWCLLVLCVSLVISAELFNSALEFLARAVTREHHPQVADALDTASGAVLVVAIGAAIVGLVVLAPPLLR